MSAISIPADVLSALLDLARHPDACPQSVPGAQSYARAYPCTCAIGQAREALSGPPAVTLYRVVGVHDSTPDNTGRADSEWVYASDARRRARELGSNFEVHFPDGRIENPSRPERLTVAELQERARKARPIANDGADPAAVREARATIRESARGILEHYQPILANKRTNPVDRQAAGLLVRLAEKDLRQYPEE